MKIIPIQAINEGTPDKPSCSPRSCPKYESCNAQICPLDHHWQKRKHLCEERICFYLLEHSKVDARAVFDVAGQAHLYQDIGRVVQAICAAHPNINKSYIRASHSGSRMNRPNPFKKTKNG